MATYFADLLQHDTAYNTASYTLFGYLMLEADEPMADKFLLPHSRAALKGWASRYPQSSRTGADPDLWFLIAKHLCDIDTRLAAVLLIQLDTYARPSEILGLRKHDVVKPVGRNKLWGIILEIQCTMNRPRPAPKMTLFSLILSMILHLPWLS